MVDTAEITSEKGEFDGLDASLYSIPEVVSTSIEVDEHEMLLQPEEKEALEIPGQTEHQLEQSTTRELVLQELAKSGRGEGFEVKNPQGTLRFNEDRTELINEKNVSITKLIEETGTEEDKAMHYESLQQLRDDDNAIVINKEQPGDGDPDTMHGSYMMRNEDGSISWGLTERKIERGEEEGTTEKEGGEVSVGNRWTTSEHTETQTIQFDGVTEVLGQLVAAHEVGVAQPNTVDASSSEEIGEQTPVVDIGILASPAVDTTETIPHETVEMGNVLTEVAHESSAPEAFSISEFLNADPLESLPVFEMQEATAHVPEAIVLDVVSSQTPRTLEIHETSMYQAIVALLKNETGAINVSERPYEEAVAEHVAEAAESDPISEFREETGEGVVMVSIENSINSVPLEAQPRATEIAQATVSIEATTVQITPTEAPATVSHTEEKIDIATILRDTENTIRIAPEVFQAGDDRKIDETGSLGVRPEALERQSIPNAHEIFLKTLGIREKTVAISQERPYNTQRAGNPTVQFPSRSSIQPSRRTASKFGISLIKA